MPYLSSAPPGVDTSQRKTQNAVQSWQAHRPRHHLCFSTCCCSSSASRVNSPIGSAAQRGGHSLACGLSGQGHRRRRGLSKGLRTRKPCLLASGGAQNSSRGERSERPAGAKRAGFHHRKREFGVQPRSGLRHVFRPAIARRNGDGFGVRGSEFGIQGGRRVRRLPHRPPQPANRGAQQRVLSWDRKRLDDDLLREIDRVPGVPRRWWAVPTLLSIFGNLVMNCNGRTGPLPGTPLAHAPRQRRTAGGGPDPDGSHDHHAFFHALGGSWSCLPCPTADAEDGQLRRHLRREAAANPRPDKPTGG